MRGVGIGVVDDERKRCDRRAHALLIGIVERRPEDRRVGVDHGGDEIRQVWVDHPVRVVADRCGCAGIADRVDGDLAGHFTGFVTTHAVGHDEQPATGMPVVLVLFSYAAGVGGDAPSEAGGWPDSRLCRVVTHGQASRLIVPMLIRRPLARAPASATMSCSPTVPYVRIYRIEVLTEAHPVRRGYAI